MYGTIFRMKPKAGHDGEIVALMDEWNRTRGPQARGARATYLLRPDNRPGELVGIAVFADRESYRANADAPEQDAWYRRLRDHLEADPAWDDGEYVVATQI